VSNSNTFGLVQQWSVAGRVYAQPLALYNVQGATSCPQNPCNLIFVATEQDMLYAFYATPQQPALAAVWSVNLASQGGWLRLRLCRLHRLQRKQF